MRYPPEDYNICPCCGTEFGFDDAYTSIGELRGQWIREGMKWWSPVEHAPTGWDPLVQLMRGVYGNATSQNSQMLSAYNYLARPIPLGHRRTKRVKIAPARLAKMSSLSVA